MVRVARFAALFTLGLAAAAAPALAQHHAPAGMGKDELDPTAARAKSVVLPASGTGTVAMEIADGRPVVPVMINGKGPFRFIVDTGASHTVIDSSLAAEVGLVKIGETHMGDPANPFAIRADRVVIDRLGVGDFELDGVHAASWNQAQGLGQRSDFPRGVIGFPAWHDLLLTLDYVDGKLSVTRGKLTPSAHTVPFTMPEGIVQIPLKIEGHDYEAHLDTGNSDFFVMPAADTAQVKFTGPLQLVGMARTVNSTFTISGGTLDGTVQLADQTYDHPYLSVQGIMPRVNVGGRLLQDYALTFDQNAMLVDFARKKVTPAPTRPLNAAPNGKIAGVGVAPQDDGSLLVAMIVPGSAVASKDIKVGDHIVKLDGQGTKDMSDDARRALMHKSPVTYTIERDGKQFDVTVEF